MRLFGLALFLTVLNQFYASHIIGGDFSVKHVSGNDFEVELRLFRDCAGSGASLESSVDVGMYDGVTNDSLTTFTIFQISLNSVQLGDQCFTPPGLCVQQGVYKGVFTLPSAPNGYYLTWCRGTRSASIVNIQNPDDIGTTFYIDQPDPALQNNSPTFGNYPSDGYFCAGTLRQLDFSATDADGDSLSYSLQTPYGYGNALVFGATSIPKPFPLVSWQAPYSLSNIVGGNPAMSIDPLTGMVTCTPSALGNFVFSVQVDEFRNGTKIGEIRRDIVYSVISCLNYQEPIVKGSQDTVVFYQKENNCFDVVGFSELDTDTAFLEILSSTNVSEGMLMQEGESVGGVITFSYWDNQVGGVEEVSINESKYGMSGENKFWGVGTTGINFCWTPDCFELGETYIEYNTYSIGCYYSDTVSHRINVKSILNEGDFIEPNIFTPNGDGVNDYYYLNGVTDPCRDSIEVQIYNRWGRLVQEYDDPNFQWDGRNKGGRNLPDGVYYVVINGRRGTFYDKSTYETSPNPIKRTTRSIYLQR